MSNYPPGMSCGPWDQLDEPPKCEACDKPGVIEYDSNGEGRFWLCARKDGDHSDEFYCGTELRDLRSMRAKS